MAKRAVSQAKRNDEPTNADAGLTAATSGNMYLGGQLYSNVLMNEMSGECPELLNLSIFSEFGTNVDLDSRKK